MKFHTQKMHALPKQKDKILTFYSTFPTLQNVAWSIPTSDSVTVKILK